MKAEHRESRVTHALTVLVQIFQCNGVNNALVQEANALPMVTALPLHDMSGGTGIVPDVWPKAFKGVANGYAGGLGPNNIAEQLPLIVAASDNRPYWVDCETHIRSNNNQQFDLTKCRSFIDQVTQRAPMLSAN